MQSNGLPALTLINFTHINMCVYMYICILFALNLKRPTMLYEDVEVNCKVICSLVKQMVFVDLGVSRMFYSSML